MPENHSRADKRVERLTVNDDPHERYRDFDPWTGESLKYGIPILTSTPAGNVVEKNVTHNIVRCPECEIPARYTHDSEPVCQNCGIVCSGKSAKKLQPVVRDAKAAGRIEDDGSQTSA